MTGDATRVIAIRHGETAWNAGLRVQGHIDIELNATGRWQADRLAAALADEELHAIYSSDLARAFATAQALARATGAPLVADRGLRERAFGEFEGLTYREIEQRWPEAADRWRRRDPGFAPAGGETLSDFQARAVQACAALVRRHPGQHVALVAHGGVLDALYRAASGAGVSAPRSWELGNATINRLLHAEGGFVLVGWNDARHLESPGDSLFGDE